MKNLKHLFTVLLLLCTTVATAHQFQVDGIYYNYTQYEEDKTVEVTWRGEYPNSYSNEYTGSVVIPESVTYNGTTYSVTSIGNWAFEDCTGLTSITIPNSVTSIGDAALSGCTGLTSITIPNSVTSIGDYAFSGCSSLTSITIPNSVTSIGNKAFSGCTGLTSVNFNAENCTSMGSSSYPVFSGCTALSTVTIGENVKNIPDCAFYGCSSITSITIPNSVTFIGRSAFDGCTGLTSVHISDLSAWCNIEFGSNDALYYAKKLYLNGELLTDLVVPDGVTKIKNYAFYNCSGLTSIEIPNSVTSIGTGAFSGCSSLTSIEIPNSVTSIGNGAFSGCSSLTSIEIPNNVTSIGFYTFYGCSGLTSVTIGNSVTSIGTDAFKNCTGLTSVTIPNSVTSIASGVFSGCSGLTSVTIPNSVTSIGNGAFSRCSGLTSVISMISAENLFAVFTDIFVNVDKNICTLYVPYGAKETYAATSGWNVFANIVELDPTEVAITINEYGSATYCSPFALDFSEVEGLKAYTAIGFNSSTQVVTLARVMTAPAETGIFIKGEPGEYVVPTIEVCNDHTLNLLVGTLEPTVVNSTDGAMSNYKFTVTDGDTAPMFYPFEDGTTLSGGKAYLQIPTAWLPVTAQKSLNIRFDDGETTDIDELKGENGEVKTIYDLQGRVVENPTSGIYIINGKKVIIK